MGFGTGITTITNGAVSQAILWLGDFQTPMMMLLGLGIFLIAAGAFIAWLR